MNRKTKKQITVVMVLLFFLAAGGWYFFRSSEVAEKQKNGKELTGVLNTVLQETSAPKPESFHAEEVKSQKLVVYVCGAVNQPGVYELEENSRLYEAVALAGGFSSEADPAYHNLARGITDGERIYILSVLETDALAVEQQVAGEEGAEESSTKDGALLNLNTATAGQLMELPGIGEAKAESILEYRKKIGKFTDIEELMNVSGIGEAMFEKIKDKIVVR